MVKKLLLLLLTSLVSQWVPAEEFSDGVLKYSIDIESKTATVIKDDSYYNLSSVYVPESVTVDGIEYAVTSIGEMAFMSCTYLQSVKLSEGLKEIGYRAFLACPNLHELTLPSTLSSIGDAAFFTSWRLTKVVSNVITPFEIPENSFQLYDYDNDVYRPSNAILYVPEGSKKAYESITGWNQFANILEQGEIIEFTDTYVKSICVENWDTDGDGELSKAEAAAVTSIGSVFKDNRSINTFVELQFFTGLKTIDAEAFTFTPLRTISIPVSVESIGSKAFYDCRELEAVYLHHETPLVIDEECFKWWDQYKGTYRTPNATLYVPKGTKTLYENAEGWKDFANIEENCIDFADETVKNICLMNWDADGDGELSKSEAAIVTSLDNVFKGNTDITSFEELQFFTGLTNIDIKEFNGCKNLRIIRLPKSLSSIGNDAFADCSLLETVVSYIENPFELNKYAFVGYANGTLHPLEFTLYVPGGTKRLYRETGWDVYGEYGEKYRKILNGTPENPGGYIIDDIVYDPIDGTTAELVDGSKAIGDITIPNIVVSGSNSYEVTEIGGGAFRGNKNLTAVVIPTSIRSIRGYSFYGCTALKNITSYIRKPFEVNAEMAIFYGDTNPLQLTLYVPAGSKPLYEESGWKNYADIVEMEDKIISFADDAVKAICVENWDTNGDGDLSEAEAAAVTSIGGGIFTQKSGVSTFNELQFFTELTSIGDEAFADCSLTSITIPSGVISIGENAFKNCCLTEIISLIQEPGDIAEATFTCYSTAVLNVPDNTKALYKEAVGWKNFYFIAEPGENLFFEVDGIRYGKMGTNRVCLIDGKNASGDYTIPYGFSYEGIWYQVKAISAGAFANNEALISIVSGIYMEEIGDNAFSGCTALKSISIGRYVKSIGTGIIGNCSALESVMSAIEEPFHVSSSTFSSWLYGSSNYKLYVPFGTTSLYQEAGWMSDESRIVEGYDGETFTAETEGENVMTFEVLSATDKTCAVVRRGIDSNTFVKRKSSDVVIPSEVNGFKVVSIKGEDVFCWVNLNSLTIPASITSIGYFSFDDRDGGSHIGSIHISDLKAWCNIDFGDNPLSYSDHLFLNGEEVKDLVIPDDVTSLGKKDDMTCPSPFADCKSLTSVTIHKALTDVGYSGGFNGCPNISSMVVEEGNPVYDSRNNCNAIIETASDMLVSGCKNTVIPDGIKTISDFAFQGCSGLTSIAIPSSVTSMGFSSFWGCNNLTSVTVFSEEPIACSISPFTNSANATLYVPKGSREAYKAADGWKDFKEIVEVVFGDANGDGDVDPEDVELVVNYIMNGNTEGLHLINADANGNKVLNVVDIVKMINAIKNR